MTVKKITSGNSEYALPLAGMGAIVGESYFSFEDYNNEDYSDGFLDPGDVLLVVKSSSGKLCIGGGNFLECEDDNVQHIVWERINKLSGNDAIGLYRCNGGCGADYDGGAIDWVIFGDPLLTKGQS